MKIRSGPSPFEVVATESPLLLPLLDRLGRCATQSHLRH
jgi:hypothetical protein